MKKKITPAHSWYPFSTIFAPRAPSRCRNRTWVRVGIPSETGWASARNRRRRCGRRSHTLRNVNRVGAKINLRRLPKRAEETRLIFGAFSFASASFTSCAQTTNEELSVHRTH
eukprot:3371228-Prymnesium_polylepis.1